MPAGAPSCPAPLLPLTSLDSRGFPHCREPQVWAPQFCPLPGSPRQREELGEGDTGAWTYHTHALSYRHPPLAPTYPFWETPGFGTSALLPGAPRRSRSWGVGGWHAGWCTDRTHVPWAPRPRLQPFSSLEPGLVEIRAVALRSVAIKGVHSVRYLCMGADGRMLGLVGVATWRAALGREAFACARRAGGALDRIRGSLASSARPARTSRGRTRGPD